MKRVCSGLLALLILPLGFQQMVIVRCFELRRDAIDQHSCENKGRPEMTCRGLCYLKKQLEQSFSAESGSAGDPKVDLLPLAQWARFRYSMQESGRPELPLRLVTMHVDPIPEMLFRPPERKELIITTSEK